MLLRKTVAENRSTRPIYHVIARKLSVDSPSIPFNFKLGALIRGTGWSQWGHVCDQGKPDWVTGQSRDVPRDALEANQACFT